MLGWNDLPLLDRLEERRADPDWIARAFSDDSTRIVSVDARGHLLVESGRLLLESTDGVRFDRERHWLLGRLEGVVHFARERDFEGGATLREAGPGLDSGQLELAATAVALAGWHRHDSRCPGCGAPTTVQSGGFARRCEAEDRLIFPRTDPAVIVAVTDAEDRLLLAHQATWGEGRVSVLAGFVEAGETLEHTVHREIAEEVGLQVDNIAYFGSQPWPFPRSLMIAFTARALGTDFEVDGQEIEWARWFTRSELRAAVASGEIGLPGAASVASRLVNSWLGEPAVGPAHRSF